jgi:hypothetical protein
MLIYIHYYLNTRSTTINISPTALGQIEIYSTRVLLVEAIRCVSEKRSSACV